MSEQSCPCGKTDAKSCAAADAAQNGKGDAPRNISAKFRRNYDSIRWKSGRLGAGEKFVKVY